MLTAGRSHKLDALELCWLFEVPCIPFFGENTDWTPQTKLPMEGPMRTSFAFLSRKFANAAPTADPSNLEVPHVVLADPNDHHLEPLEFPEFRNHTALQIESDSLS